MAQIFIFGSSSAYGVGGCEGGWADMLKRHLHQTMYGENGTGEKDELYNFAKPGVTVEFVKETFPILLKHYRNQEKVIVVLSIGLNNAKATDWPDNFVSSADDFRTAMHDLLTKMKSLVDQIIVIGYPPHDETKTLPKHNPLTGSRSYFCNERTALFEDALKNVCIDLGVKFIGLSTSHKEWVNGCLCLDGLHPNHTGYEKIFRALVSEIEL